MRAIVYRVWTNVLIVLLVITAVPFSISASTPETQYCGAEFMAKTELQVVRFSNVERIKAGVQPVQHMASVQYVARAWSREMFETGRFYHKPGFYDAMPQPNSRYGENLASGFDTFGCDPVKAAQVLVAGWMASPGHRANLLYPSHQYLGVGAYGSYVTQAFISFPADSPQPVNGIGVASPSAAPTGYVVTLTGRGFVPGERVDIRWNGTTGTILGYVYADDAGAFRGQVRVPKTLPGNYHFVPTGRSSGIRTAVPFRSTGTTSTSTFVVSPSSGGSYSWATVSGSRFIPGESVHVRWGGPTGVILANVKAGTDGTFTARVRIQNGNLGVYQIHAAGQSSGTTLTADFRITSNGTGVIVLNPNRATVGTVITVTGTGMAPGERVNLRWNGTNGSLLGYVTADSTGRYQGKVRIPTVSPHNYVIASIGATSNRTQMASIAVPPLPPPVLTIPALEPPVTTYPRPGDRTQVRGTGFGPNELVDIRDKETGKLLATVRATGTGAIGGMITVPPTTWLQITATGRVTRAQGFVEGSVDGYWSAEISATSSTVALGTTITIRGSGFRPGEIVKLSGYRGTVGAEITLGTATVSSTGHIARVVTIPPGFGWGDGKAQIKATGLTSGASAYLDISVTGPNMTFTPAVYDHYAPFTIHVSGLQPGERASFSLYYWETTAPLGSATASSTGTVSFKTSFPYWVTWCDFGSTYPLITVTGSTSKRTNTRKVEATCVRNNEVPSTTTGRAATTATIAATPVEAVVPTEDLIEIPVATEIEEPVATPNEAFGSAEEGTPAPESSLEPEEPTPADEVEEVETPAVVEADPTEDVENPGTPGLDGGDPTEEAIDPVTPEPTQEPPDPKPTEAPIQTVDASFFVRSDSGEGIPRVCLSLTGADGIATEAVCDDMDGVVDGVIWRSEIAPGEYRTSLTGLPEGAIWNEQQTYLVTADQSTPIEITVVVPVHTPTPELVAPTDEVVPTEPESFPTEAVQPTLPEPTSGEETDAAD